MDGKSTRNTVLLYFCQIASLQHSTESLQRMCTIESVWDKFLAPKHNGFEFRYIAKTAVKNETTKDKGRHITILTYMVSVFKILFEHTKYFSYDSCGGERFFVQLKIKSDLPIIKPN